MSTTTQTPWTNEDVQPVQDAVLAHFHSPDSQHATWWINTYEMATAVLDALAPRVAELQRVETAKALRHEAGLWERTALCTDLSASPAYVGQALSRRADEIERGER